MKGSELLKRAKGKRKCQKGGREEVVAEWDRD
jgi:hypothetical protein